MQIFADVCPDFEAELIEFDGEDDHVHLLVEKHLSLSYGSISKLNEYIIKDRNSS